MVVVWGTRGSAGGAGCARAGDDEDGGGATASRMPRKLPPPLRLSARMPIKAMSRKNARRKFRQGKSDQ